MLTRRYVGAALACSAVFLAGCGNGAAPEPSPPPTTAAAEKSPPTKPAPAGAEVVTLHVKGMVERLKLVGLTGPNKVQEALSGLPGVESVEADLDSDQLQVRYDPARVDPPAMLRAVAAQGFTATIVPAGPKS